MFFPCFSVVPPFSLSFFLPPQLFFCPHPPFSPLFPLHSVFFLLSLSSNLPLSFTPSLSRLLYSTHFSPLSSPLILFPPFVTIFSFSLLPRCLSLSLSYLSLSSLFVDLLTRYEQTRELLEKRKVFLLKIIASAYLPPPTPEQAPSSTKMVSNDGCAK